MSVVVAHSFFMSSPFVAIAPLANQQVFYGAQTS